MTYLETIQSLTNDPEALELAYREAVKAGKEAAFAEAVEAAYTEEGENLLLAAWHHRLAGAVSRPRGRTVAWSWTLLAGLLNGLLLWLLSDDQRFNIQIVNPLTHQRYTVMPAVALLAAPVSAALIALFLTVAGKRRWARVLAVVLGLGAAATYVLLLVPGIWPRLYQEHYLTMMIVHLGLLSWAGVGLVALARRGDQDRFAFLVKSLEAFVVAGLLAIAGGLFTAITTGLFQALSITLPTVVQRLFFAGGGGLIVVIAVALVYDPRLEPAQQSFDEGLSKLITLLMRLLLPLTVAVLLVYLAFIPFNWREPFENRDVLAVFNAMLFAVIALLVGATPVHGAELSEKMQTWLRRGVIALASLALLVSLYALAAIIYRTASYRLSPNRLLLIGWNLVNIAVLVVLLIGQARTGRQAWLRSMHRTFAIGAALYVTWSIAGLLATPWIFRNQPAAVAGLPDSILQVVYQRGEPIVLKCYGSPHIYLLEGNQKRWIRDIPTFEGQGYRWSDLSFVPCPDLRLVPDGETIPPGSGPPPQP